jgi:hypothetical protein
MTNKAKLAPKTQIAANKPYSIETPALPLPKPNTEALPKVYFEAGLLFITQETHPESIGVARAWILEFLTRGLGWPPEKITAFLESREDQLLPIFHSSSLDVQVAYKLYQKGLYNPYVTGPPGVPDWGGFPLAELPNWYSLFTKWYWDIISNSDRRKQSDQAKNFRGKRDSRDSRDSRA